MVERVNRVLIPMLQSTYEEGQEDCWDEKIQDVERHLNLAGSKTTGRSPYETLHRYQPRFEEGRLSNLAVEVITDPLTTLSQIQDKVRDNILVKQQKMKEYADKKRCNYEEYLSGDIVFIKRPIESTGSSTKLQPKYRGPMVINEALAHDTYKIVQLKHATTGRTYAATAHASQLKPWRPDLKESEEDFDTENKPEEGESEKKEYIRSEKMIDPEIPEEKDEPRRRSRRLQKQKEK